MKGSWWVSGRRQHAEANEWRGWIQGTLMRMQAVGTHQHDQPRDGRAAVVGLEGADGERAWRGVNGAGVSMDGVLV